MNSETPRAVFTRLGAGISAGRWSDLADLYAEDAVVEQPFAPHRIEGRAAIAAHFAAASRGSLTLTARDVVVHETTDPEVIIAEFTYDGVVTTTGRTLTTANIQVLRVRDGLIIASRDYHDHATLAAALSAD